jgi:glycosyltransferase involved in cell wall biosynthesis
MKLAFLNDIIFDYAFASERSTWPTGGAERQQWMLARALVAAGWEVTVGIGRRHLPASGRIHPDGVRFVSIGPGHIVPAWLRFFRRERPDWWFWQCASHLFGFGVAAAKAAGVRTIFGVGVDGDVRVREALHRRRRWWPAYALGLSWTDRIVLQHHGQFAGLPGRWHAKTSVVPNIISGTDAVIPRGARRHQVAWVAALRVAKRPDRLVAIARRLPDVTFVVCGSASTFMTPPGYSESAIVAFRATPNIVYRGQISPDDAVKLSACSSLLLSTSDAEGFPQTFLEAWSLGTPVVTLGIDPGGVIATRGLGAVCADVDAAAVEITRLLNDPGWWQTASDNARHFVDEAHSPRAAVTALERALDASRDRRSVAAAAPGAMT